MDGWFESLEELALKESKNPLSTMDEFDEAERGL